MKIYFAGSIRGGREDQNLYFEIINMLKNYGKVLTEHIGDMNLFIHGEGKDIEFIHKRDMEWLHDSDFVVAEVSTPSLGVGYELGIAESLNKKILCLYRIRLDKPLSAMVRGNKAFQTVDYENLEDLKEIFNNFLK